MKSTIGRDVADSNSCGMLPGTTPIGKLELDVLTTAFLDRAGKRTIADLTAMCACELLEIDGIGWKSMSEVIDALHNAGLSLNSQCRIQRVQ